MLKKYGMLYQIVIFEFWSSCFMAAQGSSISIFPAPPRLFGPTTSVEGTRLDHPSPCRLTLCFCATLFQCKVALSGQWGAGVRIKICFAELAFFDCETILCCSRELQMSPSSKKGLRRNVFGAIRGWTGARRVLGGCRVCALAVILGHCPGGNGAGFCVVFPPDR